MSILISIFTNPNKYSIILSLACILYTKIYFHLNMKIWMDAFRWGPPRCCIYAYHTFTNSWPGNLFCECTFVIKHCETKVSRNTGIVSYRLFCMCPGWIIHISSSITNCVSSRFTLTGFNVTKHHITQTINWKSLQVRVSTVVLNILCDVVTIACILVLSWRYTISHKKNFSRDTLLIT